MPKNRSADLNERGTARWSRWLIVGGGVALLVVVAAVVIVVCGNESDPRPLTADEVNRLATTRFRNYEMRGRHVTITVPDSGGRLVVTGIMNYRDKFGYGVVHGQGRNSSGNGLVEWSATAVLVMPVPDAPAEPPSTPPATGWYHRPLQDAGSTLDSALSIALGLGNDRPDNAQLLAQNGATLLGRDRIDDIPVEVMSGPGARTGPGAAGSVRYWLGPDATMYRVQAAVASEPEPVVIDVGGPEHDPPAPSPGLVPLR